LLEGNARDAPPHVTAIAWQFGAGLPFGASILFDMVRAIIHG
jgi:hypothetical protein